MTRAGVALLAAGVLLLAGFLGPRLVARRWPGWARMALRTAAFALASVVVVRVLGSPLAPRFARLGQDTGFAAQLVEAGWWLLGARVAVSFLRLLIVLEHRPRETRMLSDLLGGVIYVGAALALVAFAFSVPVRGLLATSGVIAIVLGLALQSTLSDVFSGIAVGLERSYKVGDLVSVEGGVEGHVSQVNWRSTQIATGQGDTAVVPNSVMAKARFVNHSAPTPRRRETVTLVLHAQAAPERCVAVLTAAVRACRVPLDAPGPEVACTGLQGDGAAYAVSFSVRDSEQLAKARGELFSQAHRHLHHAGIALAVTGAAGLAPGETPTREQLLAGSELFGVLEAGQRDLLARRFVAVQLPAGTVLVRQGQKPEALFIVTAETLEIVVEEAAGPRVVYRMSPGESLGMAGLVTGSPNAATATALTPFAACRLSRDDLAAAVEAEPALAVSLEALAQRGLAAMRRDETAGQESGLAHPDAFLARLRVFLRALND
ncbi:MAG: mechanosensitive ion channel domain-containing protein [Janthinobacterium lividum]